MLLPGVFLAPSVCTFNATSCKGLSMHSLSAVIYMCIVSAERCRVASATENDRSYTCPMPFQIPSLLSSSFPHFLVIVRSFLTVRPQLSTSVRNNPIYDLNASSLTGCKAVFQIVRSR